VQSRSGASGAIARSASSSAPASGRGPQAAPANSGTGERRVPAIATVSRFRPKRQPLTQPAPVRAGDFVPARRTLCRVATPVGNVELLVQQRGRRLHVVALSEGAVARVAAALQRARAALIAHGLHLDIESRRGNK